MGSGEFSSYRGRTFHGPGQHLHTPPKPPGPFPLSGPLPGTYRMKSGKSGMCRPPPCRFSRKACPQISCGASSVRVGFPDSVSLSFFKAELATVDLKLTAGFRCERDFPLSLRLSAADSWRESPLLSAGEDGSVFRQPVKRNTRTTAKRNRKSFRIDFTLPVTCKIPF